MAEDLFAIKSEKFQRFLAFLMAELDLSKVYIKATDEDTSVVKIKAHELFNLFETEEELVKHLYYLTMHGALEIKNVEGVNMDLVVFNTLFQTKSKLGIHPDVFFILKCDKKRLFELYDKLKVKKTTEKETRKFFISKDSQSGNYFWNDALIEVNKNSIYSDVFDALYMKKDQYGFASYETIEKFLVNKKHRAINDPQKRNKRIQNAIGNDNGFFRFAKINGTQLENRLPGGDDKVVEIIKGKGLKLKNPAL